MATSKRSEKQDDTIDISQVMLELDEAKTTIGEQAATIRGLKTQLETLRAEAAAKTNNRELVEMQIEEMRGELIATKDSNKQLSAEIGRLKAALDAAGDHHSRAQLSASTEENRRLTTEILRLKEEIARMRGAQGSHAALTAHQVEQRIKADPRARFLVVQPYSHGIFSATRGQVLAAHLYEHIAAHVRDGLLVIPADAGIEAAA